MKVTKFEVGFLRTNCYIIENENKAIVIDPGDEAGMLLDYLKDKEVPYVLLTHSHFDHIGGVPAFKKAKGSKIIIHKNEMPLYEKSEYLAAMYGFQSAKMPKPDIFLDKEGKLDFIDGFDISVLETPGHTPGGVCYIFNDFLFSGDTLFKGSIGRTDLPFADDDAMKLSLRKLKSLDKNYKIMPGHGEFSFIHKEIEDNPFL